MKSVTFGHRWSPLVTFYRLLSALTTPHLSPVISFRLFLSPPCPLSPLTYLPELDPRSPGPCPCAAAAGCPGWLPCPRCPLRARPRSRLWRWTGLRARTGERVAEGPGWLCPRTPRTEHKSAQERFCDALVHLLSPSRRGKEGLGAPGALIHPRPDRPQAPGHPEEGARAAAPPAAVAPTGPGAAGLGPCLSPGLGLLAAHGCR